MEQMFRYIKGHEKRLPWRAIPADDQPSLEPAGIGFATVLVCSEKVRKGTSVSEHAKYIGPFYLDIDDDNIKASIKSAKAVLKKLTQKFGVADNAIQIWATGKRGFHFLIEMEHFTDPEPTEKLGLVYKYMALQMKLPDNVDMSVYSGGKGRMWRLPNKKRIDNGNYKVPITPAELREMTPEIHDQLVAQPREILKAKPFTGKLSTLAAMFRLAKSKADEYEAPTPMFLDPDILESMGENKLPPCAELMRTGSELKAKGFNAISMQFGKAVAAFAPGEARQLIEEFAENYPGESYDTPKKRKDHTNVVFRTATRDPNYRWSCRSALDVLKCEPCEDCPIVHLRYAEEQEDDGTGVEDLPVFSRSSRGPSEVPAKLNGHHEALQDTPKPNGAHVNGHASLASSPDQDVQEESDKPVPEAPTPVAQPSGPVATVDLDDPDAEIPVVKIVRPTAEQKRANKLAYEAQKIADAGLALKSAKSLPPRAEAAAEPPAGDPPKKKKKAEKPTDLDAGNDVGLLTTDKGYAFLTGEGSARYISNFTLNIHKYYTEWVPNLGEDRRVAVAAKVFIDNRVVGTIIIEEQNWGSRSSFNNCLSGLSNAAFYGKDDDVIKMKTALMTNISDNAEHVRRTGSIGTHRLEVAGQNLMTYVEPGWSIDNFGYENKYYFNDTLAGAPELHRAPDLQKGDMMLESVLRAMMYSNEPVAIAQMFSWMLACFIKEHCKVYRKEFPLLGLHGNRGSGKTKGAEMLCLMHGYAPERSGLTTNLPMVSSFAIWKTISSTTTLPVIADEYNASKMKKGDKYNELGEIFKEVYQYGAVKRGTLTSNRGAGTSQMGAHVIEFPLSAPVVICSEQGISMPALVQRTIQVQLTPANLRIPGVTENFRYVLKHATYLKSFAKAANLFAIKIDPSEIESWLVEFADKVSLDIGDRPQHSFCILLAGLRFFERFCLEYEIGLLPEICNMQDTLLKYLEHEHASITEAKNRSEIDIVLEKIAAMASVSEADSSNQNLRLLEGIHYLAEGNKLYLDAPICFMLYQRYSTFIEHNSPVITDYISFKQLIKNEPYTISTTAIREGFARSRPCVLLDMEKLSIKGIDVAAFTLEGDEL